MSVDHVTILFWIGTPLLALVICAAQRKGKDYFPANLILGIAVASRAAFYVAAFAALRDVGAVTAWSQATDASAWSYAAAFVLLAWAGFLVLRVNLAKPGSSMTLTGHADLPSAEQIAESLLVIARADRHDLLNAEQRRLAEAYRLTQDARRRNRGAIRPAHKEDRR